MRFAILSDIHSNLEALEAVLRDAQECRCTDFVCLGDIVGYNASPKDCLDLIRYMEIPTVKGNHDELVSLEVLPPTTSPLTDEGIAFSRAQLAHDDIAWLATLPFVLQVRGFTIVHATLDTPSRWGYVLNDLDAGACFSYQHTSVCFIGHTHHPRAYVRDDRVRSLPHWRTLNLQPGGNRKHLINVGSVGQPRDGDWRAAYVIYDLTASHLELRRVPYDIDTARRKNRDGGLR